MLSTQDYGRRFPASFVIEAADGSLSGIAARLGATHGTFWRWRNGTFRPHPSRREAIAVETDDEAAAVAIGIIGGRFDDA